MAATEKKDVGRHRKCIYVLISLLEAITENDQRYVQWEAAKEKRLRSEKITQHFLIIGASFPSSYDTYTISNRNVRTLEPFSDEVA